MLKEEVLKKSRMEKFDEAKESYALRGIQIGFGFVSLLFVLFYVSCAIKGHTLIWRESLLAMYLTFMGSEGYAMYKFNNKKFYLVQFIMASILAVILSLATLYWIWLR